jgi:hypothetical protein
MIEPGIQPVCAALNRIPGVATRWSCEGHPDGIRTPYVTFVAAEEFARQVNFLLAHGHGPDDSLKRYWSLSGSFDPDGELQWTLRAAPGQYIHWPFRFWWRRKMNTELQRLANLLATMTPSLNKAA